ncbi:MAG: cell division FtsZ family protein [Paludibacteraceae bacterium]|nr:cell division FtsZ family protein [Paludibacteraceae bacterium]
MAKLIRPIIPDAHNNPNSVENRTKIKAIGVGGGGGNAVNYMYNEHITNVDFLIVNTDKQALSNSPIPQKIQLGEKGLGAGNDPEMGKRAAEFCIDKIKENLIDGTKVVLVTACLGKGTGTGAAPVIAGVAKEMGLLTIGIVSIPFRAEGPRRLTQAINGLKEMRKNVDSIVVVTSERIKEEFGDFAVSEAFNQANRVAATAAQGLADMISQLGIQNISITDVRNIMVDSGDALLGIGKASGIDRAKCALSDALDSTLLAKQNFSKAKHIILDFSFSTEYQATEQEVLDIKNYLQSKIDEQADIVTQMRVDESLGDALKITVILVGLEMTDDELGYKSANKLIEQRNRQMEAQRIEDAQTQNYLGENVTSANISAQTSVPNTPAANPVFKPSNPQLTQDQINEIYGGPSELDANSSFGQQQQEATAPVAETEPVSTPEEEPVMTWGTFTNLDNDNNQ